MKKKYIFFDLDGTLIDHKTNTIPESSKKAIKILKENGHELFIATGRPTSLFYGIDKELGINSFIASNGAVVQLNNKVIYDNPIDEDVVEAVVNYCVDNKIDVGFESMTEYCVNTRFSDLVDKFSDTFHLHYPEICNNYHLNNKIYQMVLFYRGKDYKKFEEMFPSLLFNLSNQYGLDVNKKGGLKDIGLRKVVEHLNLDLEDVYAFGDGFNDITMLQYAGTGIAMGNASELVKQSADMIADDISNDGLFKALLELKLI